MKGEQLGADSDGSKLEKFCHIHDQKQHFVIDVYKFRLYIK